jgi:hypothetical protein
MLLFVEIVLIVVAWRRGWGWKALQPLAAMVAFGFLAGILNANIDFEAPNALLLDICVVIPWLVFMCVKPKPVLAK